MRKGVFFTLDAFFAALIIVSAIVLLLAVQAPHSSDRTLERQAEDTVRVLTALRVDQLPQPLRTTILNETGIQQNMTLLQAIGILWATNSSALTNLTSHVAGVLNDTGNYAVVIEGRTLFENASTPFASARDRTIISQPISGIAEGRPLAGSTATALLKKIENKSTSSYGFFGGYVGEGNLTIRLDLPADVTTADVSSLVFEADIERSFSTYLNGVSCGSYAPVLTLLESTLINLASCIPNLVSGLNLFEIRFANLTNASVAGGYIRATYVTDEFRSPYLATERTQYLPGIKGIINLYDSITIPGSLTTMELFLNYSATDASTFTEFIVGELVVYRSNATGNIVVRLNSTNLTAAGLDYTRLSNATVPLRMVAFNTTQTVLTGGNADVIIITDYSASMKKDIDTWSQGNSGPVTNCEGAIYPDTNIRRTHLARCLDKEVVGIILDYPGNRVWPVHFFDQESYWYNNPSDQVALTGFFESYTQTFPQQGKGKTCLSCALNEAYDILNQYSGVNRTRHIILMSDGLPTHCGADGCAGTSTVYGSKICEGLCDVEGQNCNAAGTMCTDSSCGSAISNTRIAAQRLKNNLNVTIHAIAFGPVGTCTNATQLLQAIANLSGGTYNTSSNPIELRNLYRNISTQILETVTLNSQSVVISGNLSMSTLYPSSAIKITYDPVVLAPPQNTIELVRQTPQFSSCTPSIQFPPTITIREPYIVSYSGNHWTDGVALNGQVVFNLSDYFLPYPRLGDPYRLLLPAQNIGTSNNLVISVGDSPTERFDCSRNNSLVYTAYIPAVTPRTPVLENATGCTWTIEQDTGTFQVISIPKSYGGAKMCSYTNTSVSYDLSDAYDVGLHALLQSLDYDSDGRIFVSLDDEDIEIIVSTVSNVPYLWGPSLIEVRTWR